MQTLETIADIVTISSLVVIVPVLIGIWQKLRENRKSKTKISIELTSELQERNLRYGVLLVQDSLKGRTNEVQPLEKEDGNKHYATIKYNERFGFEFKCFAEYANHSYEEINKLLEEAGFKDVARGGNPDSQKAWFLLPRYAKVTTSRGLDNNYYYPF